MAYTTIDKPSDYFNTVLYTGNGGTQSITGVGFQPDWIWGKNRSATGSHNVIDSVRGVSKIIYTNLSDAEATDTSSFNAFGSDGFSVGSQSNVNGNGNSIVAWNWKAGTSFTNDASATGIGTIDSNGSVSSDAGFGIVKWSGTGSAGTIAHNMGSTPSYLIIKRLSDANWVVQATTLGYGNFFSFNTNAASSSDSTLVTGVSSTLVTLGTNGSVNGSGQDYIGYFFSEKQGYSKFGSYVGNGNADGTFVYTGFKPAFVLFKGLASNREWIVADNKRDPHNEVDAVIYGNTNDAEGDSDMVDFLSNGFKFRHATGPGTINTSGESYIYMSFAEAPFVTSTGVPATAR